MKYQFFVVCKICEGKPYLANFSTASLVYLYPFMYIYPKLVSHEEQDTQIATKLSQFQRAQVDFQYENSNLCSLCLQNPHMLFKATAVELVRVVH